MLRALFCSYLLSSGLYRRLRNWTGICDWLVACGLIGLRPLYRRWGFTPRPEEYSVFNFRLWGAKNPAAETAGRKSALRVLLTIRTIPSAPELNRNLRLRAARGLVGHRPLYRRWGLTPRPEDHLL